MKIKYNILTFGLLAMCVMGLSSCLKDTSNYVDFSKAGTTVSLSLGGASNFSTDAVTADTANITIAVNVASPSVPTTATTITLAVDQTLTTAYNASQSAVQYLPLPSSAYTLASTTVTVPAGQNYGYVKLTIYKKKLDPSLSYMLPVKIAGSSPSYTIASNFAVSYFHVIGNDFAGTYTYDYRRFQNGTGPGAGLIPSLGQGSVPDISNSQSTVITPVSATEFQMITNYNGQNVMYDVTFTRTIASTGVVTYSNWAVTFLAADIAKWTAAGITNMVPPKFTINPPSTSNDPKIFELNYVSGGASGRYIDDTYHK